jgi:hypothetical protein
MEANMTGKVAYFIALQLVDFLLEHELIPRRDIHRAGEAVRRGEEPDLDPDNPVGPGLLFRTHELEEWDRLSTREQREVVARAHRRKVLLQPHMEGVST